MATKGAKILPSPKGWPLVGTMIDLLKAGGAPQLHKYVDKRHKELGPIYREKIGPVTGVFVSSPEYMRKIFAVEGKYPRHIIPESWALYNDLYGHKRGLLFMDGEEWYKFRKILNPIIMRPDTRYLSEALQVVAEDLVTMWKTQGGSKNLEKELYKWSLQSIVGVLLGPESYKTHREEFSSVLDQLSVGIHGIFEESAKLSLLPAKLAKTLQLKPWKEFVRTVDSTFKQAEELLKGLNKLDSNGMLTQLKQSQINEPNLCRIVLDLILAAGDTTAYTTQWLLYNLGKHTNIQKELYEEIKMADMSMALESQSLRAVLKETLRMYPVAPFITRYMSQDVLIEGYFIGKDVSYQEEKELVIMSLYSSGRDEQSFPNAEVFQPKRWKRSENGYENVVNPQASLPFAMGARACIGKKIAETQIITTILRVLQSFDVKVLNDKNIEIELHLIAVPSEPVQLNLQPR